MEDYKEFTFGWMIFVFAIPIHLLLSYLYINDIGENPISTNGFVGINLTFFLMYLLSYGLTTKINADSITVSFGIGLISKKILLTRIKTVDTIIIPWYYGWGIRLFLNGTLFNISGKDGIELKFKDTNRIIRIGTKDSSILKDEIEKRLV